MTFSEKYFIFVPIFLVLFLCYSGIGILIQGNEEDNACTKLGFEKYSGSSISGIPDSCEDNEGNIHFVKVECKNLFIWFKGMECSAKEIKVGEVWGVGGD